MSLKYMYICMDIWLKIERLFYLFGGGGVLLPIKARI